MTENATSPPTPEQRLAAGEKYQQLAEQLQTRFRGSDQSSEKLAHINLMLEQGKIRDAREPSAPPPTEQPWQARRQHREEQRALRSELLTETAEGSAEAKAIIEDVIQEQRAYDQKQPAQPKPGALTWQDVEHAPSTQEWLPESRTKLATLGAALDFSPAEGLEIAALARHVGPTAAAAPRVDWPGRWGAAFTQNQASLDRVLATLSDGDADWLEQNGLGRAGTEDLIEKLVEIGERLATR